MKEEEQQDKSEQAKEKGTFQVEERVLAESEKLEIEKLEPFLHIGIY